MKNIFLILIILLFANIGMAQVGRMQPVQPSREITPTQSSREIVPVVELSARELKNSRVGVSQQIISQLERQGVTLSSRELESVSATTSNIMDDTFTGDTTTRISIVISYDFDDKKLTIKIVW